jgi:hypothetical protein
MPDSYLYVSSRVRYGPLKKLAIVEEFARATPEGKLKIMQEHNLPATEIVDWQVKVATEGVRALRATRR